MAAPWQKNVAGMLSFVWTSTAFSKKPAIEASEWYALTTTGSPGGHGC
jgi:hypothetical protein